MCVNSWATSIQMNHIINQPTNYLPHQGCPPEWTLVTQREVEYITVATNLNKLIMSSFSSNWLDRKLPLISHN